MTQQLFAEILIQAIPILFAIVFHEVAHGYVAHLRGDDTAKEQGRLTINPVKHIDVMGTIIVPATLIALQAPFLFGWAKPVPVNWNRLKHPRWDMALVAAAGPISNLLMALFWAIVMKILIFSQHETPVILAFISMAQAGILINIVLFALNALPIPPLDGSRVAASMISKRAVYRLHEWERYGFVLIVVLLITGLLNGILGPIISFFYRLIYQWFGIS